MFLGEFLKDPHTSRAVDVDWNTYVPLTDSISGAPVWTVASGLTIDGTPTIVAGVATARVGGGQEGVDGLVTCRINLASGATEEVSILCRVRTGEKEPRLSR